MKFDFDDKNVALQKSERSLGESKLEGDEKKWGKKQYIIFGSVTGFFIIAFVVWVLSFKSEESEDAPDDEKYSPMLSVYNEMPDFARYK